MDNKYGSMWNKWDFHVHTPYSILNNNYGFNPFTVTDEEENEKLFDEYVLKLFTKAIEENIVAIGITDYFMINGYKRITEQYLNNPDKLIALFPDSDIREKIKKIYIFPNIELRLNTFVGKDANSVNYHVIFSNTVSIQDINDNFIQQLKFNQDAENEVSLTKANIEQYGRSLIENNGETGSELLVGLKHISLNDNMILQTLKRHKSFEGKYIITIPVDEDLSLIPWTGRDYTPRKNLYQQCHCYMTSNQRTIKWALAEGEEEIRKKEFGSIKPCIWGSDAHEYDRMFKTEKDRFCWVKAEPSFEGLLQILYEPKERVMIQKNYPDEKDIHQIIESIQFNDENFQTEPIVFNDYLTCIIGGKSTGKSLLLQQLAKNIDPDYAEDQEKISALKRKKFPVNQAKVTWKDGTSDSRKIVYIPQTFLNRTIDNPEETTAINSIIENVLHQEQEISQAYSVLNEKLKKISKSVQFNITNYCESIRNLKELEETIKQEGHPDSFKKILEQLESERIELASKININQEEIDKYALLENEIKDLELIQKSYSTEMADFMSLENPTVIIPGYYENDSIIEENNPFCKNFPHICEQINHTLHVLNELILPEWKKTHKNISNDLEEKIENIDKQLGIKRTEYNQLKTKVEQSEQLQKLSLRISSEKTKLQDAEERQKTKTSLLNTIENLKNQILNSQKDFSVAYTDYCSIVIKTGTQKDTTLTFDAKPVWKQNDFQNSLGNIFDNRNFSSFKGEYRFDLQSLMSTSYGEELLNAIWEAMMQPNTVGGLSLKSSYTLEKALQLIFSDWYNIHYIVQSGNDTIEEMSPGKKALVLLELLISLEDCKCPILIDQPEDDLDNRSIYDDLVQYIKRKKKERQIIIVTHNANVVLGADAEEVIIANQDGKDTKNMSKRFEYRSGAIESDSIGLDDNGNMLPGILNEFGIQTQICDILEGGHPAFELRKNKYTKIVH